MRQPTVKEGLLGYSEIVKTDWDEATRDLAFIDPELIKTVRITEMRQ